MSKVNISSSGTRILRVLKALRGHALNGVSNGELASALGESPANINRALNTLIEEGLAMKLENGRFAPGIQLLQIAMAHSHRDLLQPAQQSGAGHAKFSTGSVVYCTAFTMPRVTCRAGDINQSFSQGSIHWLCLQPVNLWRRLSQP